MTNCTNCRRQSDLYLCSRCQKDLTAILRDLPGWLTALQEDAYGQTRHGESVRRSTDKGSPALCKLGPDGSFKRSPGQWLTYTHSVAVEWAADVCETRGIPIPALDTTGFIRLLARHVNTIANDKAAHVAYREFEQIRDTIMRIVDRPRSPLFVGLCPTVTAFRNETLWPVSLVIAPGATHVKCRDCKETYAVRDLIKWRLDDLPDDVMFTAGEILDIMALIDTPIPERTWRRWRYGWPGRPAPIQPVGELYGEPAYRIQDVREFRTKWTREKAGAR